MVTKQNMNENPKTILWPNLLDVLQAINMTGDSHLLTVHTPHTLHLIPTSYYLDLKTFVWLK